MEAQMQVEIERAQADEALRDDPLREAAEAIVNRWMGGETILTEEFEALRDALGWADA